MAWVAMARKPWPSGRTLKRTRPAKDVAMGNRRGHRVPGAACDGAQRPSQYGRNPAGHVRSGAKRERCPMHGPAMAGIGPQPSVSL